MKDALDIKDVACHPADEMLFVRIGDQPKLLGFGKPLDNPPKERFNIDLEEGQTLTVGSIQMKVLHTPGHTPGSCCFLFEKQKVLISGDTLFRCSIGRMDLPGGSPRDMLTSFRRLLALPGDIFVIPGHICCTTIEFEQQYNHCDKYIESLIFSSRS